MMWLAEGCPSANYLFIIKVFENFLQEEWIIIIVLCGFKEGKIALMAKSY
ncbi:hypothetical protein Q2T46_04430 [Thermoanaerobacterium sp. CMT5567-10]|nr:hypothetical protein [Thermoanaerobacterium sp. CMT5567-10]WKV09691.1 hypothetical protein Q2T46_04430 [Thermoanaerobacterium sp. CMT5567-10]